MQGSTCVKAAQTSQQQSVALGGLGACPESKARRGNLQSKRTSGSSKEQCERAGCGSRAGAWLPSGNDRQRSPVSTAAGKGSARARDRAEEAPF